MKCNNCGTELQEGEKFCTTCGQPVAEQTSEKQTAASNLEEKPKKSLGFKIGIAALIIAVIAVGTVAGAKISGIIKKATMSPSEYYQYVETKNRDESEKMFLGYYDAMRESFSGDSYAKNINMKLEISDTAKSLLSLTGVDFSSVKNLELDVVTGKEGKEYSNQVKVRGNDNDLLTMNSFMDLKDKKAYYQIPELSESYLDVSSVFNEKNIENESDVNDLDDTDSIDDIEDLDEEDTAVGNRIPGGNALMSMCDLDKILIKTENLKDIYERYTDILIKSAKNVQKSEGGCEAEGVSQKADKYTVTMDGKEVSELLRKLMETLKSDKVLKEFIENIDKDVYQEFTDAVEDSLNSMDESDAGNLTATMEVHIDGKERIIGRKFILKGSEEEEIVVNMLYPKDGDNFGFMLTVASDDVEYFKIHGKGTEKSGILNGEFTLGIDESLNKSGKSLTSMDKLLTVTMEDYDLSKYEKGEVSGTIIYSTEAVAALANYSLKIEGKGNMKESTGKISILAGKDALVTIDSTMKSNAKLESVKPSGSDIIYDVEDSSDMLSYQTEMDFIQLLGDIQEKLGIDLSSLLGGM